MVPAIQEPAGLLVTAIIPTYRRPEKLRKAVRSLLRQDFDPERYEVIVVDSSPDDANRSVVSDLQAEARCPLRFFKKPPEGPGPSRNLGAREARGRFLAFMDSDCQASLSWLREGIAAFDSRIGLVQGKTLPEPGVPHSVFNHYIVVEKESLLYETANMLYRRKAFEQVGGFLADVNPRADTPMGGEDIDLAWRCKRNGWQSRFAADAIVYHEVVRMPHWRWIFGKRLFIYPLLLKKFPEVRAMAFAGIFFDRIQAWLVVALGGTALTAWTPWMLLLCVPYVASRALQSSRTLRGPMRLARVFVYFPRDLASLGILLAGSIRYRYLLL
jgi:glycosyltransferase involved in cell wall biosynthesis